MIYSFNVGKHKIEFEFTVKDHLGLPEIDKITSCFLVNKNGDYRKIKPSKDVIVEFYYNIEKDESAMRSMETELYIEQLNRSDYDASNIYYDRYKTMER